jgi:hypothetical protein
MTYATTTVTVVSSFQTQWTPTYWCYPNYPYYCNPGYPSYPNYPNYPGYPGYTYQTVTTATYASYFTTAIGSATTITLTPIAGTTVHAAWIIITPLQGGDFSVVLSAQGLQPGGIYLIEGIIGGTQVTTAPFASTTTASEFSADGQGNGIYSTILTTDPRIGYTNVLLLYLPNNQIANSVLVAIGTLS